MDGREIHEACGVVAIADLEESAPQLTVAALFSLQHRGQESAGVASVDGEGLQLERGMGLVSEVFPSGRPETLAGTMAVGHVRYSTSGSPSLENAQPFTFRSRYGTFALAHNGNLVNALELRRRLEGEGAIFQTTTDTEVVAHLIAHSRRDTLVEALQEALMQVRGGYALVVLSKAGLLAVRDPLALRPLVFGQREGRAAAVSESCALVALDLPLDGDVAGGELVTIDPQARIHRRPGFLPEGPRSLCSFEYIYFARPDSVIAGRTVQMVRRRLGEELAKEAPVDADIVVGVPDSSLPAAEGFARTLKLPLEQGLAKNRYVGRTFIQPSQGERELTLRLKLVPVGEVIAGKRVALVDDSLVRGTTASHLVRLLRQAGASEVHLRIASPPYRHPCHYGIDTSNREELVATGRDEATIARWVGADSLAFLSADGVGRAIGESGCMACFTGRYPLSVVGAGTKRAAEVGP